MKRTIVLAVSFGLNLALLGEVFYLAKSLKSARARQAPVQLATKLNQPSIPRVAGTNSSDNQGKEPVVFNWRSVESEDYRAYIRNLRSIGCPEETVRDIIIADVAKLYDQKRAALLPKSASQPWKPGFDAPLALNPQLAQQSGALEKEQQQVLSQLLGPGWEAALDSTGFLYDYEESHYGFLAADKREKLRAWERKFAERELEIQTRAVGGMLSTEDEQALKDLEKARQQELVSILDATELKEYELRHSPTAQALRQGMVGYELTEEEFGTIFQWRKAFDQLYGDNLWFADLALSDQQAQDKKKLDEQVRNLLGDKRYAEYQRGQDPDFQDLFQIVQRYSLAQDIATSIYDLQQSVRTQSEKIQGNSALSPDQKNAALSQLERQTENTVRELLGDKAFDLYHKRFP
jgi:hypothetical protein